jgi:uncharacterized damage-inducible protein DinB
MYEISAQISEAVDKLKPEMQKISAEEARRKPAPNKWSKQEILGHLVDSAYNNMQRVVRSKYNKSHAFPPWEQDEWMSVQQYNQAGWQEVIDLFTLNNRQFCRAINNLPPEAFNAECNMGKGPVTLNDVLKEYIRHMNHHIAQLVGKP